MASAQGNTCVGCGRLYIVDMSLHWVTGVVWYVAFDERVHLHCCVNLKFYEKATFLR